MADRPGELARVAEALGKAGVNIESIAGFGTGGGSGEARLLVADTGAARRALEGAGCMVTGEREMAFVDLDDKPGSLATAARKLADKGVNIDAVYVVGQAGGKKQLAIGSSDATKARSALV